MEVSVQNVPDAAQGCSPLALPQKSPLTTVSKSETQTQNANALDRRREGVSRQRVLGGRRDLQDKHLHNFDYYVAMTSEWTTKVKLAVRVVPALPTIEASALSLRSHQAIRLSTSCHAHGKDEFEHEALRAVTVTIKLLWLSFAFGEPSYLPKCTSLGFSYPPRVHASTNVTNSV
eukprot:1358669-Rhodomonas_salina.2